MQRRSLFSKLGTLSGLLFALLLSAQAQDTGITFSREYNVSNHEIVLYRAEKRIKYDAPIDDQVTDAERNALLKLRDFIQADCKECAMETVEKGKWGEEYVFRFPNGSGFKIAIDPGVVEVQPFHETNASFRENIEQREYIFKAFKKAGLHAELPPFKKQEFANLLKGHPKSSKAYIDELTEAYNETLREASEVNIGARSAFGDDVESFLRFFSDWSQRPMTLGIFNNDKASVLQNGPPLRYLDLARQQAFRQIVKDFYAGKIRTLDQAARRILSDVYTKSLILPGEADAKHSQGISIKYLGTPEFKKTDMPIEIRTLFQPRSAQEDLLMRELMEKYILFIKSQKGKPIRYNPEEWTHLKESPSYEFLLPGALALEYFFFCFEIGADTVRYLPLVSAELEPLLEPALKQILLHQDVPPDEIPFMMTMALHGLHHSPYREEYVQALFTRITLSETSWRNLESQTKERYRHAPEIKKWFLNQFKNLPGYVPPALECSKGLIRP